VSDTSKNKSRRNYAERPNTASSYSGRDVLVRVNFMILAPVETKPKQKA
jgi:hypothetical protein